MEERKDNRLKYLELPDAYKSQASEISLWVKQSQRSCEKLATHLSKEKAKSGIEFERSEYLKDFVLKTSESNEKVLKLLDYLTGFLTEVMEDSKVLIEGAVIRDRLQMQSDSIEVLFETNEKAIQQIHDLRKNQINP